MHNDIDTQTWLTNRARLMDLLNENRISQSEYNLLIKSLDKKQSKFSIFLRFMLNPFDYITQYPAFFSGLVIIFMLSYVGNITSMNFSGFVGVDFVRGQQFDYVEILANLFIIWLCISLFSYLICKLLGGYGLRIFDFFAFCGLAKLPFFFAMLLDSISYHIDQRLLDNEHSGQGIFINIYGGILDTIVIIFIFWHLILYYQAFKAASGLNNQRRWFGFIVTMVVTNSLLTVWLNPPL